MKKVLVGALLLVAACGVRAQEPSAKPGSAAAGFSSTSAAQVQLVGVSSDGSAVTAASSDTSEAASSAPAAPLPAADPAPTPKFVFGERDDYRWQLGVGFDYVRFQSNAWNANLLGLDTTLAYYTNSWFGLEGDVISSFSPNAVSANNHAKLLGYMGGFRVGGRRQRWEPWLHGLVGGSHLQPQTALGGRNALMAMGGGGMDYRIHARLSFRLEADYVYTGYFSRTQNNLQAVAGVVLHF